MSIAIYYIGIPLTSHFIIVTLSTILSLLLSFNFYLPFLSSVFHLLFHCRSNPIVGRSSSPLPLLFSPFFRLEGMRYPRATAWCGSEAINSHDFAKRFMASRDHGLFKPMAMLWSFHSRGCDYFWNDIFLFYLCIFVF